MDVSDPVWKCWGISTQVPAVKRLQFLYNKLQEAVKKFREESKTLSQELVKPLERFFEIECAPEVFIFFTRNTSEQDIKCFLGTTGVMNADSLSVWKGTKPEVAACRLKDRMASHVPYVVVIMVAEADIAARQVLPHCIFQLIPRSKESVTQDSVISINAEANCPHEFRVFIDRLLEIEPFLCDNQKPNGYSIFMRDDRMIMDLISKRIEIILQKNVKSLIALIDEVNDVPPPLLEQEVHIVVILNESAARKFLPRRVTKKTYDEHVYHRQQVIWNFVQYIRNNIISENKEKLGHLLSCQSKEKGIKLSLHSSLKEHFQCYIDGLIIGAVFTTRFATSKRFSDDSQLSSGVAELLRIIHDLLPFITNEIQNELKQKAGQILQLQKMLNDWKGCLTGFLERCSPSSDIPLEVQIGLSRINGVKTFGHWGGSFHIGIDAFLDRNKCITQLQEAVGNYVKIEASMVEEYRPPVFHFKPGDQVNQSNSRNGMITMFVLNENESINHNLYFLTCKHVAPEHRQPVYIKECRNCQYPCTCPTKEFGLSVYSFGPEQESIVEGLVDITCVKVYDEHVPLCDMNIRGCQTKLSDIQHFKGTMEDNIGKAVFKWGSSNTMIPGTYDGVMYIDPKEFIQATASQMPETRNGHNVQYRRIDLIRSCQEFGKPGESGALICIQEERPGLADIISPALVYLGSFMPNLYMSFRLQEGIDCLYNEHQIHLQQCTNNSCRRPRLFPQNCRKRRANEDILLTS